MYLLSSRHDCSRILALASLELDAAASSFEQRRVARHRRGCPECDATIARMAGITDRVRSASPVAPPSLATVAWAAPRRRLGTPTLAAACAAVALAVAGIGPLVGSAGHGPTGAERRIPHSRTQIAIDQRLVIERKQSGGGHQLAAGPPSSYQLG
jgi:predicted anti-sigma-YlaC factor YlaD